MTDSLRTVGASGAPAPAQDEAPWNTVLAALGTLANVEVLGDWPELPQPPGRAAAVNTPVTYRPYEFPGMAAPTSFRELAIALGMAIGQSHAALAAKPAIETFIPGRQRYGERSVVVRADGVPIVVAGSWLKGRGVYALVVEAAYVQHVVLPTAGETLAITAHN